MTAGLRDQRIHGCILVRGSAIGLKKFLEETKTQALDQGLEVLLVRSSASRLWIADRGRA